MSRNAYLFRYLLIAVAASVIVMTGCNYSPELQAAVLTRPALPAPDLRLAASRQFTLIDFSPDAPTAAEYNALYNATRSLYWSGTGKQLEKLAEDFNTDYRRESDMFRRADMLKTMAPELLKHYAQAASTRDYRIRSSQFMTVLPYDRIKQRFPLLFGSAPQRVAKDDQARLNNKVWQISYLGVPATAHYYPRDPAEAAAIEAALARRRTARVQYQGTAVGVDTAAGGLADVSLFRVEAISALAPDSGQVLFTVASASGR